MGYVLKRTHETVRCVDCGLPVQSALGKDRRICCDFCLEWLFIGTALWTSEMSRRHWNRNAAGTTQPAASGSGS